MSAGDWKDLYSAATAGDLARVRHHIRSGVDPNYQHPEIMSTPLVASLVHGHDEISRYLLENGADPDLRSEFEGLTPLEAARRLERKDVVKVLLDRGAREQPPPFWRRWFTT